MTSLRALFILATILVGGCSSHMYASEAVSYSNAVTQELDRLGVCREKSACPKVFWEAGGFSIGPLKTGGVHLNVYGVKEISTADALAERCKQLHSQSPQVSLTLVIYATDHPASSSSGAPVIIKNVQFSK